MKTVLLMSVVVLVSCAGCANNSDLAGRWGGFVVEKGRSTQVELDLRPAEDRIEGTFIILAKTKAGPVVGSTHEIVRARRSGDKLEFIVPITGKIDDDAVAFEFKIEKGDLVGQGHELRKDSTTLTAALRKIE